MGNRTIAITIYCEYGDEFEPNRFHGMVFAGEPWGQQGFVGATGTSEVLGPVLRESMRMARSVAALEQLDDMLGKI